MFLRRFQPLPDDVKLDRWCLDSLLGFLLKSMEGIDSPGELHRVDGPIRTSIEVRHHLQYAGSDKPLQDLGIDVLSAQLSLKDRSRLSDRLPAGNVKSLWVDPIQKSGFAGPGSPVLMVCQMWHGLAALSRGFPGRYRLLQSGQVKQGIGGIIQGLTEIWGVMEAEKGPNGVTKPVRPPEDAS